MENGFKKNRIKSQSGNVVTYHRGPEFNNGAQEMVFNSAFSLPRLLFRGAARLAGTLSIFPANPYEQNYTNVQSGLGGIPAGFMYSQPLIDSEPVVSSK
jgi:hypothetical protein